MESISTFLDDSSCSSALTLPTAESRLVLLLLISSSRAATLTEEVPKSTSREAALVTAESRSVLLLSKSPSRAATLAIKLFSSSSREAVLSIESLIISLCWLTSTWAARKASSRALSSSWVVSRMECFSKCAASFSEMTSEWVLCMSETCSWWESSKAAISASLASSSAPLLSFSPWSAVISAFLSSSALPLLVISTSRAATLAAAESSALPLLVFSPCRVEICVSFIASAAVSNADFSSRAVNLTIEMSRSVLILSSSLCRAATLVTVVLSSSPLLVISTSRAATLATVDSRSAFLLVSAAVSNADLSSSTCTLSSETDKAWDRFCPSAVSNADLSSSTCTLSSETDSSFSFSAKPWARLCPSFSLWATNLIDSSSELCVLANSCSFWARDWDLFWTNLVESSNKLCVPDSCVWSSLIRAMLFPSSVFIFPFRVDTSSSFWAKEWASIFNFPFRVDTSSSLSERNFCRDVLSFSSFARECALSSLSWAIFSPEAKLSASLPLKSVFSASRALSCSVNASICVLLYSAHSPVSFSRSCSDSWNWRAESCVSSCACSSCCCSWVCFAACARLSFWAFYSVINIEGCLRVDISMLVMDDDSAIKIYDRRRSELSSTPLRIK